MRTVFASLLALLLLVAPEPSAARDDAFTSSERLLDWLYAYRAKPEVDRVPRAVHAMRRLGLLEDQDKAGFFIGFIAGVLGQNPAKAQRLVEAMFPMPPKEQAVIIKAIAYSGLPDWQHLLFTVGERMPERQALIEKFLSGEEKPLLQVPLESGTAVIYTLWGYYVATGYHDPVVRIISALHWSRKLEELNGFSWSHVLASVGWGSREIDLDRLAIGSTAKWTLVSYAERDRPLIDLYRAELDYQPGVAAPLQEVIEAAQLFEADRIRKEEARLMEDARRHNLVQPSPGSRAASAGSVAIATGCVVAGATGNVGIAVPCVVGGAVYSGVVKLFSR